MRAGRVVRGGAASRATLGKGLVLFEQAMGRAEGSRISGDDAFTLSDTFGIPREQIEEWAEEAGLTVDVERFASLLEEQRARARAAVKKVEIGLDAGAVPPTEFVGYDSLDAEAAITMLLDADHGELDTAQEGDDVLVFLGRTPFYAEAGGQVGDHGEIRTDTGVVRVRDAVWAGPSSIMHVGSVASGEVRAGQETLAEIDRPRREATARAHTSTHVVHWTLKHILGEHARQAGSLVAPGRLRFDFPHPSSVPIDTLERAELEANRLLARDDAPNIFETSMREAEALGATMLFDEKYGDVVRVVEIGDYSRELCGGTHVDRTGRVGVLRILHEGSIGAGMRRVEALVGPDALRGDQRRTGAVARPRRGDRQHRPEGCAGARSPRDRGEQAAQERARTARPAAGGRAGSTSSSRRLCRSTASGSCTP